MLLQSSGVTIRRTLDRSGAEVPAHAHDWPLLSLFVMGSYSNRTERDERFIAGPSAVFYAPGSAHHNVAGIDGFEQIEIEFDPEWLCAAQLPCGPVSRWMGGPDSTQARRLAGLCSAGTPEGLLRAALRQFLQAAPIAAPEPPPWLDAVIRSLKEDPARKVSELARRAGLHPSWLGTAYRRVAGEGLMESAARFRVERAACLLRETALPFPQVAAETGFCDQSHMIRTFRRVLGRLPSAVRDERTQFRQR